MTIFEAKQEICKVFEDFLKKRIPKGPLTWHYEDCEEEIIKILKEFKEKNCVKIENINRGS